MLYLGRWSVVDEMDDCDSSGNSLLLNSWSLLKTLKVLYPCTVDKQACSSWPGSTDLRNGFSYFCTVHDLDRLLSHREGDISPQINGASQRNLTLHLYFTTEKWRNWRDFRGWARSFLYQNYVYFSSLATCMYILIFGFWRHPVGFGLFLRTIYI